MSRHFFARKKYMSGVFDSFRHFKDWFFVDNDHTRVEILRPTLDNISLMREFGLTNVIKGFGSPVEYSIVRRMCLKYDISMAKVVMMTINVDDMATVISCLMNGDPIPAFDIPKEDLKIVDDNEENRVLLRNREIYRMKALRKRIGTYCGKCIRSNRLCVLE